MFRHDVSTVEIGIAARGKCILRTSASFSTSDAHGRAGRLAEEAEQHHVHQQQHGIVRDVAAEVDDLAEHHVEDAEQQQRPHDRPQRAEHRVEVGDPELRPRHQPGQAREPPPAARERAEGPVERSVTRRSQATGGASGAGRDLDADTACPSAPAADGGRRSSTSAARSTSVTISTPADPRLTAQPTYQRSEASRGSSSSMRHLERLARPRDAGGHAARRRPSSPRTRGCPRGRRSTAPPAGASISSCASIDGVERERLAVGDRVEPRAPSRRCTRPRACSRRARRCARSRGRCARRS